MTPEENELALLRAVVRRVSSKADDALSQDEDGRWRWVVSSNWPRLTPAEVVVVRRAVACGAPSDA